MPGHPDGFGVEYGAVEHEYDRFRLRRCLPPAAIRPRDPSPSVAIFLVLGPGERLDRLGEGVEVIGESGAGDEVMVSSMRADTTDLPRVLCHLTLGLQLDQQILATQRQSLERLRAQEGQANAQLAAGQLETEDPVPLAERIADDQRRISHLEARARLVERALVEVEAQHPDIEVGSLLEAYQEELHHPPDARQRAAAHRREREWWGELYRGQEWARHNVLGEVVAQHGRFRVHEGFWLAPGGRMVPKLTYPIRVEPGPPQLLFVAPLGTPVTPRPDRATMVEYLGYWLQYLRESIELGREALRTTQDAELAAQIQAGLHERERQDALVAQALRELDEGPERRHDPSRSAR